MIWRLFSLCRCSRPLFARASTRWLLLLARVAAAARMHARSGGGGACSRVLARLLPRIHGDGRRQHGGGSCGAREVHAVAVTRGRIRGRGQSSAARARTPMAVAGRRRRRRAWPRMGAPGVPRYVAASRADGEAWGGSATTERRWQIASSRPATMAAAPATSRESEREKKRARTREWRGARAWLSLKACGAVALLVAMV